MTTNTSRTTGGRGQTYASIVETLTAWYGEVAQAITLGVPENPADDDQLAAVIEDLQS